MHWSTKVTPSRNPYAVTPSDTVPLPTVPKGIYVGTGGDVRLQGVGATAPVTYVNVPAGAFIAVEVSQVFATGTTASDLIAEA